MNKIQTEQVKMHFPIKKFSNGNVKESYNYLLELEKCIWITQTYIHTSHL